LVEQYPEAASSAQALLALGEATVKAGLLDDAVRVYTKAFHTGTTAESRAEAAFKAGQCLFRQQQYEQALRWLTRSLDLAAKTRTKGPDGISLFVGETYLAMGKFAPAAETLDRAVEDCSDKTEYMEALSALVKARIGQDDCVGALNALDREPPWPLTRKDRADLMIVRAHVLRTMGLAEKAIGLLEEGLGSAGDPNQRVQIYYELASCHQALGQWEPARNELAQVLMATEPGPLAQQAGLDLAFVSLKMGQADAAIALCRQVLDAGPDEPTRQRAAGLMATAYEGQHEYGKAAESLLSPGRAKPAGAASGSQSPSKEVTRVEG
jgi:tetratricopeptide (TPR) repeat protein